MDKTLCTVWYENYLALSVGVSTDPKMINDKGHKQPSPPLGGFSCMGEMGEGGGRGGGTILRCFCSFCLDHSLQYANISLIACWYAAKF